MAYQLQQLRTVMANRPEWQARLETHVSAIEANIAVRPDQCVAEARTLFEAVARTLCGDLGLVGVNGHDISKQISAIIKALDMRFDGHPRATEIDKHLKQLVGALNGAIGAITALSNIGGLRHGAHLDWPKLQPHHASMLGGFCDTFIAFVIETACAIPTQT